MKNKELSEILSKVFPKAKIPKNIDNLKIGDFEEWDSIGSVNLILEIEKKYKIKFTTINFLEATSIKKIKNIISSKKKAY